MNEESTVMPDAREGSPTAPRGAPEAWWASAAPRPFGGSQSGGGLPPREADRDPGANSFGLPPSNRAVKCVAAPSPVCPGSPPSAPARVPHPAYRGRCLGAQPAGRSGRAEDSADARADTARLRAPPHTALPPIARPSPCHQHSDRVRRRPTPPAPLPIGGWAAGGRFAGAASCRALRIRALLGGAAGGGSAGQASFARLVAAYSELGASTRSDSEKGCFVFAP